MLKQQLQKTEDEIVHDLIDDNGLKYYYRRNGGHTEDATVEDIKNLVYEAQIKAVKAFAEEVKEKPLNWCIANGHECYCQEAYNQAITDINNLLKDI